MPGTVDEYGKAEGGGWSSRFDAILVGFSVDAQDGEVGRVSYVTYASDYMVVDTGQWIFRRRVVVPTSIVEDIDPVGERIALPLTRDDLKGGPEYEPGWQFNPAYLESVALYYDARLPSGTNR